MVKTQQLPKLPTFSHIKKGVCEQNYALVPFPLSQKDFNIAVAHFFEFLTLSDDLKNQFQSNIIPGDEESFVGYIKREKEKQVDVATSEVFYDQKEYFHYNRYAEKDFKDLIETEDKKIKNFFESARIIYEHAEDLATHIIEELNAEVIGELEQFFGSGTSDPVFIEPAPDGRS